MCRRGALLLKPEMPEVPPRSLRLAAVGISPLSAEKVYCRLKEDYKSVGADKVMDIMRREGGCALGRTATSEVPGKLKSGLSVLEIVGNRGQGRGGQGVAKKCPPKVNLGQDISKEIEKNPRTAVNSQRLLAKKMSASKGSVCRAVKKLNLKAFKRVKVCATTPAKLAKRRDGAKAIAGGIASGKWQASAIFWSGGSFFDTAGNRYNVRNNRIYSSKLNKRGDIIDQLAPPQKQRGPGVMLFMCVSSIGGGLVFEPHVVPPKQTVTSEYYVDHILKPLIPRMRASLLRQPEGTKWAFMQDQASPHTAKSTMSFLAQQGVTVLPWFPSGADANPLDIFVRNSIKNKLGELPKEHYNTAPKLEAALLHIAESSRQSPEWMSSIAKRCNEVPHRLQWIIKNGGAKIVGKKWSDSM